MFMKVLFYFFKTAKLDFDGPEHKDILEASTRKYHYSIAIDLQTIFYTKKQSPINSVFVFWASGFILGFEKCIKKSS